MSRDNTRLAHIPLMQQETTFIETVVVNIGGVFPVEFLTRVLTSVTNTRYFFFNTKLLVPFDSSDSVTLTATLHIRAVPFYQVEGRCLDLHTRSVGSEVEIDVGHFSERRVE